MKACLAQDKHNSTPTVFPQYLFAITKASSILRYSYCLAIITDILGFLAAGSSRNRFPPFSLSQLLPFFESFTPPGHSVLHLALLRITQHGSALLNIASITQHC